MMRSETVMWWVACVAVLGGGVALGGEVALGDEVALGGGVARDLEMAEVCDPAACLLPECRCSSAGTPGGLATRDVPQLVLLTFDDGINVLNVRTYRHLLDARANSNGCPARATFFVSHEYTDYQLVNELYNKGHEIALHSISHQTPQSYWAEADVDTLLLEFGDQRLLMSHFANIPYTSIKGIRQPFLQLSGNATFQMIEEVELDYDCSWMTNSHLFPYSLHYASTQECLMGPCPSASLPDAWVLPMVAWRDNGDFPCAMVDACAVAPNLSDEDAWFDFMVQNFERHYMGTRAPFGFYVHEAFLSGYPAVASATERFLDLVTSLQDAFMVTASEAVEWTRNPIPLPEFRSQPCATRVPSTCSPVSCGPLYSTHTQIGYYMSSCAPCPATYPWLGNPFGF